MGFSKRAHSLRARGDCNNERLLVHPFYWSRTGGIVAAVVGLGRHQEHGLTTPRHQAARELLAFYREAGVDVLLEETPTDRFAGDDATAAPAMRAKDAAPRAEERTPARPFPPRERELKGRIAPPPSPEAAVLAAREAAKRAATLEELRAILERFEGCALRTTATQLVFADGDPRARVMFVGEAPGRDEDVEGLPFVGRSGKLLDRMMAAIGLDRSSAYIANIVPWRPPGNRTPTPQESAICLPFTLRQIELADPDILVCLGNPSTQTLLNSKDGIIKTRGRWFSFHTGTREIRAIATLHPAYLLRQPLQKRLAWRDFLAIKKALAANRSATSDGSAA
ncbi:MAG: uracil-DNA glycosylase [Alphaproteobacteria bacterium]|nr:MAG: uracil-DNA glycosylase [Alphaproteobacteria bacterium]